MSYIIKPDELISENCYRIENGVRKTFNVTAKSKRGFKPETQTDKFHNLPEVKDLNAPAPVDKDGYTGWALHYMYFLDKQ